MKFCIVSRRVPAVFRIGALALVAAALNAGVAAAAGPPPVGAAPEQTTASYGDWVLRCARAGEGAAAQRLCEVAQTITVQDRQRPIAEIAIGRPGKGASMRLTVVLPINIYIPAEPRVATEAKDAKPIELQWQRCIPRGCFAAADLKEETVARLRDRTDQGRIEFKDSAQRDVAIPFSFRGLPQALDALGRE